MVRMMKTLPGDRPLSTSTATAYQAQKGALADAKAHGAQ
jgi:hypothetical protein